MSNRSNRSNSQGRRTPLGNLPRTIATPAYSKYSASLTPASDSLSIHSRSDFIASEHSPGWNVSHVYTPDSVASRRSMFSQSTVGDEGEGAWRDADSIVGSGAASPVSVQSTQFQQENHMHSVRNTYEDPDSTFMMEDSLIIPTAATVHKNDDNDAHRDNNGERDSTRMLDSMYVPSPTSTIHSEDTMEGDSMDGLNHTWMEVDSLARYVTPFFCSLIINLTST